MPPRDRMGVCSGPMGVRVHSPAAVPTTTSWRLSGGVTLSKTTLPFRTWPSMVVFSGAWSLKSQFHSLGPVSYTHLTLPTIYSV